MTPESDDTMREAAHEPATGREPDTSAVVESGEAHRSPGRGRWIAGGVLLVVAIGLTIAAVAGAFSGASQQAAPPVSTETAPPAPKPTPGPTPAPTVVPLPDPVIDIPSVQKMPYSEVWNPPDQGQYIWQIVDPAFGYPEAGGTRYILAHACEDQSCAGDSFRTLQEGDTLTFLGQRYQVTESREIMKTDIAAQDIWSHDPNRLIIITCIIDTTWDQSNRNDIIIAKRV